MKKTVAFLWSIIMLMILGAGSPAWAQLIVIGQAGYDADGVNGIEADEYFNLIWDNDDGLVWLDYSNDPVYWSNGGAQVRWAASLGSALDIQLFDGYSVTWTDDAWHLPDTEMVGYDEDGGYELLTSDLGHLFYIELGNLPSIYEGTWGNPETGLANTGPFENLLAAVYFENSYETNPSDGTPDWMWIFYMNSGREKVNSYYNLTAYGIAVRGADVVAPVPVPGTLTLLGWGVLTIAGIKRTAQ